jgi:hypothetical protein
MALIAAVNGHIITFESGNANRPGEVVMKSYQNHLLDNGADALYLSVEQTRDLAAALLKAADDAICKKGERHAS